MNYSSTHYFPNHLVDFFVPETEDQFLSWIRSVALHWLKQSFTNLHQQRIWAKGVYFTPILTLQFWKSSNLYPSCVAEALPPLLCLGILCYFLSSLTRLRLEHKLRKQDSKLHYPLMGMEAPRCIWANCQPVAVELEEYHFLEMVIFCIEKISQESSQQLFFPFLLLAKGMERFTVIATVLLLKRTRNKVCHSNNPASCSLHSRWAYKLEPNMSATKNSHCVYRGSICAVKFNSKERAA